VPSQKQQREAARRHLERQLKARQEREARRKKVTLITSIVGTLVLIVAVVAIVVGTSGNSGKKSPAANASNSQTPSTSPSATTAAATYPCTWTADGAASKKAVKPATTTPPKTGIVTVSVKTTQGPMTFRLNRAAAPCTVDSFVSLVRQHYYDSTPCHRLVTSGIYVLQCGDPTGTGTGGPGYSIPDEATGKETYPAGTIAMARTQAPHSGGSQFFIVYKDSPALMQNLGSLQYTVFGKVTVGMSVVDKVAAKGATTGTDGKPKLPITLTQLAVTK
jgi:peptidyl-prolyl cis-trans isomerase B (cyclophilin B)